MSGFPLLPPPQKKLATCLNREVGLEPLRNFSMVKFGGQIRWFLTEGDSVLQGVFHYKMCIVG